MKIVQHGVFLQYGVESAPLYNYNTHLRVSASEANKFVALDSASGGYPYATEIQHAHDFKTVEAAKKYAEGFHFDVRQVTVTYEIK